MSWTDITATAALPHWLTCSSSYPAEQAMERLELGDWSKPIAASAFGCTGYRVHETGAKLYHDQENTLSVLDVPGDPCESWGSEWLGWSTRIQGRVTRIDLARDIGPTEAARKRMLQMRRAWFGAKVDTRIRKFQEHRSYDAGDGFTWYFGGSSSPLRLRVYDRRGPLRLEFQWRPSDKEAILASLLARDLDAAWRMLAQKIKFEFSWYNKLLIGACPTWHTEKPETDWERTAAAIKAQYGVTLWGLRLLGIDAPQLEIAANDDTDRGALAKLLKWSHQAGHRGESLRACIAPLMEARKTRNGRPRKKPADTPCQMGV